MRKKVLALTLAFCMIFTMVLGDSAIYASAAEKGAQDESVSEEGEALDDAETGDAEEEKEQDADELKEDTDAEDGNEDDKAPETEDETEDDKNEEDGDEANSEDETDAEETESEEEIADEDIDSEESEDIEEDTKKDTEVKEEADKEEADSLFPGMPKGFQLSAEQVSAKQALSNGEVNAVAALQSAEEGEDYVAGQVFFCTEDETFAEQAAAAYGGELISYEYGVAVISLPEKASVADAIAAAADTDNNLPAVEPNYIYTTGPAVEEPLSLTGILDRNTASGIAKETQWEDWADGDEHLDPESDYYEWRHEMVDSYSAWGTTQGNSDVVVAVLDSGINKDHVDLVGQVLSSDSFVRNSSGEYRGWSAGDHGTNVGGIIASTYGNHKGGAGIAPNVKLRDYQVLYSPDTSPASGSTVGILEGLSKAIEDGVDIINMSLGSSYYTKAYQDLVTKAAEAGIVVVVAAGNDGSNIKSYPAGYKNVVCVGAVNRDGTRASFSNAGSWVTVSAPGVQMYAPYFNDNNKYGEMSGTSQATPTVAGVVALYMSATGNKDGDVNGDGRRTKADVNAVVKALKAGCTKCPSSGMGAGIVNAGNMMASLVSPPTITLTLFGKKTTGGKLILPSDTTTTDSYLTLDTGMENSQIVYTLDGTTPSAGNGELRNGNEYSEPLSLDDFPAGTYTVKAITVNGSGLSSKVVKCSFTIMRTIYGSVGNEDTTISGITISAPPFIAKGKSVSLSYVLAGGLKGKPKWSILEESRSIASVDKDTGKVTAKNSAKAGDSIVVRATLGTAYSDIVIRVIDPVTKITLSAEQGGNPLQSGGKVIDNETIVMTPVIMKGEEDCSDRADFLLTWKSSDKKIATVDSDGIVTPVGKGKVTITATATDGSGKSGTFKLDIQRAVTGMTLTKSSVYAAKGKSVTYKVTYFPASAANASCNWSVDDTAKEKGVTIKKGVLQVPRNFTESTITVTATLKDKSKSVSDTIEVLAPVASVTLGTTLAYGVTYDKKNHKLSKIQLYTTDVDDSAYGNIDETTTTLSCTALSASQEDTGADIIWKSSNPAVVSVDENGKLQAKKAGSATITAAPNDGSGKSAKVTVSVIVPASGITIAGKSIKSCDNVFYYENKIGSGGLSYMIMGKSETMTAHLETLYGNPSIKKVKWSVPENEIGISINSKGVLKVSSKNRALKKYIAEEGYLIIPVMAETTDGTKLSNEIPVCLIQPTKVMAMPKQGKSFSTYIYDENDNEYYKISNLTLEQPSIIDWNGNEMYFYSDSLAGEFTVKGVPGKLNADICTSYRVKVGGKTYNLLYYKNGKYYPLYRVSLLDVKAPTYINSLGSEMVSVRNKTESVPLTITATDGSKKSITCKVKIKY